MRKLLKKFRNLVVLGVMLYLLPSYACASLYGQCILSYDFGNRAQTTVSLPSIGNACFQKCSQQCSPFINPAQIQNGVNQSNDQAAKCMNMCQKGMTFTGFVTQPQQGTSVMQVFRTLVASNSSAGYSYTTTDFCSDADLSDQCGFDTGIVRPMGAIVTISFDNTDGPPSNVFPQTANTIFSCGYNEVALEPVIYSSKYDDWYNNQLWLTPDNNGNLIWNSAAPLPSWLPNLGGTSTPNASVVQGQHLCLGVLSQQGLQNLTNWNLWGGYSVTGQGADIALQPNLWNYSGSSGNPYMQAEFTDPKKAAIYNYQNTCAWHARNLNPVNTGIYIKDGDFLKLYWTQLVNSGYQSLGGIPAASTIPSVNATTPACLPNKTLYEYFINGFNSLIDSDNTVVSYSNQTCEQVVGSNYISGDGDFSKLDLVNGGFKFYGTGKLVTGADIASTCSQLQGYQFNYHGPSTAIPQDTPCIFGSSSGCQDVAGGITPLFTPLLASKGGNISVYISESSPAVNYTTNYWQYSGNQTPGYNDGMVSGAIAQSGQYPQAAPGYETPSITQYCVADGNMNPPGMMPFFAVQATEGVNFLACSNYHFWEYCSGEWTSCPFSGGMGCHEKGLPCNNAPMVNYNPNYQNFHCYPQNFLPTTSQPAKPASQLTFADGLNTIGYTYETCRGADMPIIWDDAKGQMFISTAVTNPNTSLFGKRLLKGVIDPSNPSCSDGLACLNGYLQANTAWKANQWSSFGGGMGFRLFCQGLADPSAHQLQANLINQNNDIIYTVVRNSQPLSKSYAIGQNIIYVNSSDYDRIFGAPGSAKVLTHHYEYLQAIGSLINNSAQTQYFKDCTELTQKGCSGPYTGIISAMSGNTQNLPVVPKESPCSSVTNLNAVSGGSCGSAGSSAAVTTSYQSQMKNYNLNDPLYEWFLRSSLEVYLNGTNVARYSPSKQQSSGCYNGPTYGLTGAMFDTAAFQSQKSINTQGASQPPSQNIGDFASSWQDINNFYGLTPNLVSAPVQMVTDGSVTSSTGISLQNGITTLESAPPRDFIYQVSGVLSGVGSTPQALSLRHPSRDVGQPDSMMLWNQLGGTNAYVMWGGCPVNSVSPNLDIQYKLVNANANSCSSAVGDVIQDWTSLPAGVLCGDPLTIGQGTGYIANGTTQARILLRARLKGDSDATYSQECSGTEQNNTCANNRFGTLNLSLSYVSALSGEGASNDPFSNSIGNMVTLVFQILFGDGTAGNIGAVGKIYNALVVDNQLISMARAIVALYIAFLGIKLMMGMLKDPKSELIKSVIKVSIVLVVTSPQSFELFYNQIFKQLAGATTGLVNTFVQSSLLNYQQQLMVNDIYDPGAMFMFLSAGWKMLLSPAIWIKVMALVFTGYMGFIVAIVVVLALVIYAINIIKVVATIMLSYIGLGLLIIIAPIFICFMLFKSTQQMFSVWWQQLLGFIITPPLIFMGVMIFNFLAIAAIGNTLNFTACPACLVDIDMAGISWCLMIYRPLIYTSVPDPSIVSPLYMPIGLVSTSLMLLIVVYCMYIFIEYVQMLVLRIVSYTLNPALMGGGQEGMDVRAARWLTGRDQETQMMMQRGNPVGDSLGGIYDEVKGASGQASGDSKDGWSKARKGIDT